MADTIQQMNSSYELINMAVAELRAAGVDELVIASVLFNEAGLIWRTTLCPSNLRKVVLHAAEVAITGQPQPLPE